MEPVTPDLAEKVLTADSRNVVQKIADGGTLTSGQRESLLQSTTFQSSPEEIKKARLAALLHKWCKGRRLSEDEKAEIAHLLPRSALDNPPSPPRSQPAEYQHRLQVYADRYETDVRNIKRWIKTGRDVPPDKPADPPPLDDPVHMPAWWSRHMKHRVPQKLLTLAQSASCSAATASMPVIPPASPPVESPQSLSPSSTSISSGVGELGMGAALQRVREAEREASDALAQARRENPPDSGKIEMTQRAWERAFEALRKAEKDSPEVLAAMGDLISKADVARELMEIHGNIEQGVRSLARSALATMGVVLTPVQDARWNEEVDRLFDLFRSTDFLVNK